MALYYEYKINGLTFINSICRLTAAVKGGWYDKVQKVLEISSATATGYYQWIAFIEALWFVDCIDGFSISLDAV